MLPSFLKPLDDAQYERLEVLAPFYGFAGMLGAWLCVKFKLPAGLLTCLSCVWLMAAVGSYMSRRTERGIWMLALFFGVSGAAFYILCVAMTVRDRLQGKAPSTALLALDIATSVIVLVLSIRASWTVFIQNRELSRTPPR